MGVTSPRSPSRATQAESIRGPALVVLSAVLYAIGNVFSKSLYNHHMSQVSVFLFRAIITYFLNAGIAEVGGSESGRQVLLLRTPTRRAAVLAFARGCAGFGQVMLLNLSFDLAVSVADAFALKEALGTIMTVLVARLLLGTEEKLSWREILGVVAVLGGLLLIAQPPFLFGPLRIATVNSPKTATLPRWAGFIMLVGGAMFQSAQNLLTRVLSRAGGEHTVTPATLLSYYMVALGLCSLIAAVLARDDGKATKHWARFTMPRAAVDLLLLAGVVGAGTCGQLAVAAGARTTTASKVALLAINEL